MLHITKFCQLDMSLEHFWIEIKTNFWKNLASTQKSLPKFTKPNPANPGSLAITETSTPDLDPTTKAVHYIWELKDNNVPYNTKWSIFSKANTFNPVTKKCRLCLKEVYYILYKPETAYEIKLCSYLRGKAKNFLENILL